MCIRDRTGSVNLIIPASTTGGTATRVYIVQDATDRTTANKYTLSIKTAGSSNPIPVPVGSTMLIHSDGTDARLDILQKGNFAITSSSITAYTAVAGDNLLIDTAAAQVTITLPASPSMGDEVSISWSVSNADTCNATGRWSGIKSSSGNETVTVSGAGNNNFGLSCSGEGGQASETVVVFAFNLAANNTTLSVDEDGSIINTSVAVQPNTDVPVSYTLLSSTSNGTLTFNEADATLNYYPSPNYNGVDEFIFKAIAAERSVEKDIKTGSKSNKTELSKIVAEKLAKKAGKPKWEVEEIDHSDVKKKIAEKFEKGLRSAFKEIDKKKRSTAISEIENKCKEMFAEDENVTENQAMAQLKSLEKDIVRTAILKDKKRIDGRGLADVRQIKCEVGVLPRTHGSALFTRGETQALVVTTLGMTDDEQRLESLEGMQRSNFMLHYNFPPFSVGECGRIGTGRREIGHGKLAWRAINSSLPLSLIHI